MILFGSSESSGFSLTFEQSKDVSLPDWALHVSHQASVGVVDECHLHLSDASSGTYTINVTHCSDKKEIARSKRYIENMDPATMSSFRRLPVLPMICLTVAYVISPWVSILIELSKRYILIIAKVP